MQNPQDAAIEGAWVGCAPDPGELVCGHMTVRRYLAEGGWVAYRRRGRQRTLAGHGRWVTEHFWRHAGNADVVRRELEAFAPPQRPGFPPTGLLACAGSPNGSLHYLQILRRRSKSDSAIAGRQGWAGGGLRAMRGLRTGPHRRSRWRRTFNRCRDNLWLHRRGLHHRARNRPESIPGHQLVRGR
jgi:hypothetical protein